MEDVIQRDRINPAKLQLIYNGINTETFESAYSDRNRTRRALGIHAKEKVVICVANLIPYKGHSDLLKAARRVLDRNHDTKFLLVGEDRGIRHILDEEVQALAIDGNILFLGRRLDIASLFAASDISVLPSHEEGFSNVILESMAAGLAVVATHVGGNSESVIHGKTGWLVPPRQPDALADKIIDLLQDPKKTLLWGRRGRKRVQESFPVQKMIKKHLALYQSADSV